MKLLIGTTEVMRRKERYVDVFLFFFIHSQFLLYASTIYNDFFFVFVFLHLLFFMPLTENLNLRIKGIIIIVINFFCVQFFIATTNVLGDKQIYILNKLWKRR